MKLLDAIRDARLFAHPFGDESWRAWRRFLSALPLCTHLHQPARRSPDHSAARIAAQRLARRRTRSAVIGVRTASTAKTAIVR